MFLEKWGELRESLFKELGFLRYKSGNGSHLPTGNPKVVIQHLLMFKVDFDDNFAAFISKPVVVLPPRPDGKLYSVNSLLEHAFLIAEDHVRGFNFNQSFQTVVPDDHPASFPPA